MARREPDDPGLPFAFHPLSNGEYAPLPRSPLVRETVRRVLDTADTNARRLGMSRRAFLSSSAGMALTLATLSACNKEKSGGNAGGTFSVPPDATVDDTAAVETFTPTSTSTGPTSTSPVVPADFVMDVQTHLLEFAPGSVTSADIGFIQASCGPDAAECMGVDAWLDLVMGASDTTIAVISAIPVVTDPDPLSIEVMEKARHAAEQVGCSDRVLIQGHATPTMGELSAALDAMAEVAAEHDISAWKAYTHEGPAWRLDDDVGFAFCDQVRSLGQRIVCVHKGLGPAAASPEDVGAAAADHPDLMFCIYHSGFEVGVEEGPYPARQATGTLRGVDRLIRSCELARLGRGANVYPELGSTWWNLVQRPDEAAHVLGKLLVAFGEDNVLWGTDSIWYGSPQSQIDAFRTFEISQEFQERFGYPALTPLVKAKILGLNAAQVYGVDPTAVKCTYSPAERRDLRAEVGVLAPAGPTTATQARRVFAADHPWFR